MKRFVTILALAAIAWPAAAEQTLSLAGKWRFALERTGVGLTERWVEHKLLTIPGQQVRNFETAPVTLGFSSIFWNTAWTQRQPPTTL
jgi:hypothetical protein